MLLKARVFQRLPRRLWRGLHGSAANPGVSEAELQQRVDSWRIPFQSHPLGFSETEFDQLHEDGFVTKEIFDPEELKAPLAKIEELVDELANDLYNGGKIQHLHEDAGVFQRLSLIEDQFPDAGVLLHKKGVLPKDFQDLWAHPRLLAIAEQMLGPEIVGHPVWNLRCKVPQRQHAVVPWHQDTAYLDPSCWSSFQLTAWIPMLHATRGNGCMEVLRGGHRTGRTAHHTCCVGDTWYVDLPTEEISSTLAVTEQDAVVCEVPLGSVLFLNNLIPHRSLANTSNDVRWSFDFRFQRPTDATGFEQVKPYIKLQSQEPGFQRDWTEWANLERTAKQGAVASVASVGSVASEVATKNAEVGTDSDPFDTRIAGPWMLQWEMTHSNRHTDLLQSMDQDQQFHKA